MAGAGLAGRRVALVGAGELGAALAMAMIAHGGLAPARLRVATASGRAERLSEFAGVTVTRDAAEAAAGADITLLAVPPAAAAGLRLDGGGGTVVSVMAGVTLERLQAIAGHGHVVRAMSSPVAALGLASSVFIRGPGCTTADSHAAQAVFAPAGTCDEVGAEGLIDVFTALTGPVPGFVAGFAEMLVDYAVARGVDPDTADRAVRQLVLASGTVLATTKPTPGARVEEMIAYAGTTAAGLRALRASGMKDAVAEALDASVARAQTIAG